MSKRILFLSESLNVGGAEKALVSILKLMDYTKYDVTLCLISKTGAFAHEVSSIKGLKIKCIKAPSKNSIKSLINVIKIKAIYSWLPANIVGNYLCRGYDVVVAFCEGYLTKWVGASSVRCHKIAWVHTDMISNGVTVAAGAVVSGNVPDYCVVGGVPAKILKYKCSKEDAAKMNDLAWWNLPDTDVMTMADKLKLPIPKFLNPLTK